MLPGRGPAGRGAAGRGRVRRPAAAAAAAAGSGAAPGSAPGRPALREPRATGAGAAGCAAAGASTGAGAAGAGACRSPDRCGRCGFGGGLLGGRLRRASAGGGLGGARHRRGGGEGVPELAYDGGLDGRRCRPDELTHLLELGHDDLALDTELLGELVDPDLATSLLSRSGPDPDRRQTVVTAWGHSSVRAHRVLISVSTRFRVFDVNWTDWLPPRPVGRGREVDCDDGGWARQKATARDRPAQSNASNASASRATRQRHASDPPPSRARSAARSSGAGTRSARGKARRRSAWARQAGSGCRWAPRPGSRRPGSGTAAPSTGDDPQQRRRRARGRGSRRRCAPGPTGSGTAQVAGLGASAGRRARPRRRRAGRPAVGSTSGRMSMRQPVSRAAEPGVLALACRWPARAGSRAR